MTARPIGAPGSQAVDWEERVNPERLRNYRFDRVRKALEASELGALLVFDFNNIRNAVILVRRGSAPARHEACTEERRRKGQSGSVVRSHARITH